MAKLMKNNERSKYRNLGGLPTLALYLSVNLPIYFLSSSLFYDEWVYLSDPSQISLLARECPVDLCKSPFLHYLYPPIVEHGVVLLRISIVLSWLASAVIYGKILRLTPGLSDFQRSVCSQVFLMLPIFGARVAMSEYVFEVLIFLCGAFLIVRRGTLSMGLGYVVVTFAAFFPSLQMFGITIVFVLVSQDFHQHKSLSLTTFVCSLFMLLQPIVHRVLLQDLLVDIGEKSAAIGYNSFSLKYVIRAISVGVALITPLTVQLIRHLKSGSHYINFRPGLFTVGLSVLALGTIPYVAVGHFPTITDWVIPSLPDAGDWSSRHQLLQGFGYSLLVGGMISALLPKFQRVGLTLTLGICALLTFSTNLSYYLDGHKQSDFIAQIQAIKPSIPGSSKFVIRDLATDFNARHRVLRSYEWEAMLELALDRSITVLDWNQLDPLATCPMKRPITLLTVRPRTGRLRVLLSDVSSVQVESSEAEICA